MFRTRTQTTPTLLSRHYQWRTASLSALSEFTLARAKQTATAFEGVIATLEKAKRPLADDEARCIGVVEEIFRAFQMLCQWVEAKRTGEADANRHLESAKTCSALALEGINSTRFIVFREAAAKAATAISTVTSINELLGVAALIAQIPVPPFLVAATAPFGDAAPKHHKDQNSEADDEPLVVRVMLTVDGKPWANPQMLQAGTVYDTALTVTIPRWPKEADRLKFDFVTTLPPEHYRISTFEIEKPKLVGTREFTLRGQVEFPVPQSLLSDAALLQLRATFLATKDASFGKSARVIGYHKLRARASDPTRTPLLSKFPAIDTRILDVVEQVRGLPGVTERHLADFVGALSAVANYMGICAQHALYRTGQKIDEGNFQRDLLVHMSRELGADVMEAPKQGGGITDIRYRSVIVELKVEDKVADRDEMLRGYESQPTQYSSAVGSQLGILCVLDLSEKINPPAPPQNSIRLLAPKLHGFEPGNAPFPARIAALVIDGNLRQPSSYSR
jgi:hypothetical protein